jgi:hypothetical protein
MTKWQKQTLKMAQNHTWEASPGFKILVLDRGAARIDIPEDWVIAPGENCLEVRDRPQPDDRCLIQLTVFPQIEGVDFSAMPLVPLFENVTNTDSTDTLLRGPVFQDKRKDLEFVWRETRYIDPEEKREACTRNCFARRVGIHLLISFSNWPEDVDEFTFAWDEILRSLRIGEYRDPKTGWRIR